MNIKDGLLRFLRRIFLPLFGTIVTLWRRLCGNTSDPIVDGENIQHVFVLMLENHSFDQMLGCYHPRVDGVNADELRSNFDKAGKPYIQRAMFDDAVPHDPDHEYTAVAEQLRDNNGGFVRSYQTAYSDASDDAIQSVMNYFPKGSLPALHYLADNFTVCDHWFSSVPGPTWANRLFALSATSMGRVEMFPKNLEGCLGYSQETVFDRLENGNKSWRVYFHDVPESLLFQRQQHAARIANYCPIDGEGLAKSLEEALKHEAKSFPQFCFIEPQYFGSDQNDDHPTASITAAQQLIARVYNAIRSVDEVWKSSLLFVVYDEHGGFYDHCPPPTDVAAPAVPPNYAYKDHGQKCDFKSLGVRVPAILVSPWVEKDVFKQDLDHTSMIKYLCRRWGLPSLTARDEMAGTFDSVFLTTLREIPFKPLDLPVRAKVAARVAGEAPPPESEHQVALRGLIQHLEEQHLDAAGHAMRAAAPSHDSSAEMQHRALNVMRSIENKGS